MVLVGKSGGGKHEGVFQPSGQSVEVDVVAQNGHTWIEVKSHQPFGTDSDHWFGSQGHTKGALGMSVLKCATSPLCKVTASGL